MAHRQGNGDIQSYPSFLSSSVFPEDLSIKNQLSFGLNNDDNIFDIAFQSLSEIKLEDIKHKDKLMSKGAHLQLRRCTSFEQMLMENHRTVLVDSICQYFQKIQHDFLKNAKCLTTFQGKASKDSQKNTIKQAQVLISNILSQNSQISQLTVSRIMTRLSENPDQLSIVSDMLKICPKKIQFQILFLICTLLQECNEVIQHFKRKHLPKQLKERSIKLAAQFKEMTYLGYLFESEKVKDVTGHFQVLIEKLMITLFLMKVGVFENELETKSIDDCLTSQVFRKIDLNDLLNQHLIRPAKKNKKQAQ